MNKNLKKKKLAINGGNPVLKKPLPRVYNIGKEEIAAALRVLKRGPLSDFVGAKGPYFLGGKEVKNFEAQFCKKFKVKYAVSFNSATTALHAAIAALGIGPGDEVIVPPYTMSASATCILMNGAVPIFADIDERTFCLDPKSVKKRITKRTKAIMAVDLFGGVCDFDALFKIAKKYKLKIIEDNAQAPGALYKGKYAGTMGDIGVFSFNMHKTIQAGEGGVLVTNNKNYALRARMVRNHGEVLASDMPKYKEPIMGSNYRMSELHAAICAEQLKKMDFLNKKRIALAQYLTQCLKKIKGIGTPYLMPKTKHVYYVYPIKINEKAFGISRDKFVDAMTAEGFPMSKGYVSPIYFLPIFQRKQVFNKTKFPFEYEKYKGRPDYSKGICPVCERMKEKDLTFTTICQYNYTRKEIDLFVMAIEKILSRKVELL